MSFHPRSHIPNLVLIDSIFQKFYSFKCFYIMQISKISGEAELYGPKGFFVEHIELELCVKSQVNQICGVRGMAYFNKS